MEEKKEEEVVAEPVIESSEKKNGVLGSGKARPKRGRGGKNSKQGADAVDNSRFHCNYCGRDLSMTIRARCAECTDFDLCLDCFSVGATLWPHTATHAYRLVEIVTKPIYSESWGADEEERLLEGLEMYGVGNWEDIAKIIQTRNKRETEQHFEQIYLNPEFAPIPDMYRETLLPKDDPEWLEEEAEPDPKALKVMHLHQNELIAGWMPKRADFVYEWDNEAEDVIAQMEITDEDSKSEKEIKTRVLEVYNSKLDERQKRKEFVVSRGLLDVKSNEQQDKKRPREEKELRDKMKVFARYQTDADHQAFLKGILDERSVRQEIELQREGRMLGAKSAAECGRMGCARSKSRTSFLDELNGSQESRRRSSSAMKDGSKHGDADGNGAAGNHTENKPGSMEGADLLSRSEVELCRALKISFHQYMIVKDVMIRESLRNKHLRRKDAKSLVKTLVKMDPTKVGRIYEYLVNCKWVTSGSVTTPTTSTPGTPSGSQSKAINGIVR